MDNVVDLNTLGSTLADPANTEPNTQQEQPQTQEQQASPEAQQPKQPGWIHQRIEDGVNKRLPEIEARIRNEIEQKYAPLQEYMLNAQAQELVTSGKIQDLEMAKEYVRMKNGGDIPLPQQESTQQRDSKGRFAAPKQGADQQPDNDPAIQMKAEMLYDQAQRVQKRTGVDVMTLYKNDPAIQAKIGSGEWDFYDVAENAGQPNMPSPMRSPNGGATGAVSIADLSDAQFEQMQRNIERGYSYRPQK